MIQCASLAIQISLLANLGKLGSCSVQYLVVASAQVLSSKAVLSFAEECSVPDGLRFETAGV
jgi:hypothetical protein